MPDAFVQGGIGGAMSTRLGALPRGDALPLVGAVVLLGIVLAALLAPWLAPFDPVAPPDLAARLADPSSTHPLGTDDLGRDVLSRLLFGARISLTVAFLAVGMSVALGTALGAVAGYAGGWWDTLIARFVDIVLAVPRLVLLIVIVAVLQEPSPWTIVLVLGLTQWPQIARLVRGEVLSIKERDYVRAAEALGCSPRRVLARHILPNTLGPVIVASTLGIANTIVLEAGLSFLGLGVQPPTPSWGAMVADGRGHLLEAWWISTFAGLAIVATVVSFNLVGEGLRQAVDPKSRSRHHRVP
jgi:peptide/nickel transport system permease protein